MGRPKANLEVPDAPADRASWRRRSRAASTHPMMNAVGGTTHPLDGPLLAATCPGTSRRAARRSGAGAPDRSRPGRRSRTGRSPTRTSSRTTTRPSTCTAFPGKAGNIKGRIDPRRQHLRGAAVTGVPESAASRDGLDAADDRRGEGASAGTRSRARRRSGRASYNGPAGVRVPRLLHRLRLPRGSRRLSTEINGIPEAEKTGTTEGRHATRG